MYFSKTLRELDARSKGRAFSDYQYEGNMEKQLGPTLRYRDDSESTILQKQREAAERRVLRREIRRLAPEMTSTFINSAKVLRQILEGLKRLAKENEKTK